MLRGLGCSPRLAAFRADGKTLVKASDGTPKWDVKLYVTRLAADGVVLVNDAVITVGEEVQLAHHDKVTLGRAHVFRVYIDNADVKDQNASTPRGKGGRRLSMGSNDAIQQTIREIIGIENALDSNKIYLAQNFIQQLKNIAVDHEPKVLSYLYEAKKTKRLVDEANEITQAVRPQDNLRFELDAASPVLFMGFPPDFLPHLVVRVVRVLT